MLNRMHLSALALAVLLVTAIPATAGLITYQGRFTLDNTSSISGAPKGDSFDFRLTLDGSSPDTVHTSSSNAGGGLTFDGQYIGAVTGFQMTRDSANAGTWDPSGLAYDFAGSNLLTTDVNTDPVLVPPMNEHLTIDIPVASIGAPVKRVYFNLYNSMLYSPNAMRQLWLDTSTPTNGFTLSDLFLHGMSTLPEFQSIRPPTSMALVDSVFLFGESGTFGSGTVDNLSAVPVPSSMACFAAGLLGLLGWKRRATPD